MESPTEQLISFSKKKLISLCKERDISGISKLNRFELIALLSIDSEVIAEPTVEPTIKPTVEPTVEPTIKPTVEPTVEPTIKPTVEPTVEPMPEPMPEAIPESIEEAIEEDTSKCIINLLISFFTLNIIFTSIYVYMRF